MLIVMKLLQRFLLRKKRKREKWLMYVQKGYYLQDKVLRFSKVVVGE